MKVSTSEPFKLIYSLYEHQYFGVLFESFVVQLNAKNQLTFLNQNISSKNIKEFDKELDYIDYELVKAMDAINQDSVLKKFNTKKLQNFDFFLKVYDPEKGDKNLKETIFDYLEKYRAEILEKLKNKPLFIMGKDGEPTWKSVEYIQEKAKVYFNFDRQEENTIYFPVIKCKGENVKFQFKNAKILCDTPAYLLTEEKLYSFEGNVDGKKLRPFLNKGNIVIPRSIEPTYFEKFVSPLVAHFNVFARGFEINLEQHDSSPVLLVSELSTENKPIKSIFNDDDSDSIIEDTKIVIDLSFNYGSYNFRFDSFAANAYVNLEKKEDSWIFHKVRRDLNYEKQTLGTLKVLEMDLKQGRISLDKHKAFSWLQRNAEILKDNNIAVKQNTVNPKQYFLGYSSIEVKIEEKRDWFDIKTKVRFGEFEIPFIKIRQYIIANKREFLLPNGLIAVIPEEWFTRYLELFNLAESELDEEFTLKKHHFAMIQDLSQDGLTTSVMGRKLEKLRGFEEIEEIDLPKHFKGNLRPYQKAAYDWLHFLQSYNFGGCLADDMGLGKTVMTLAFLQSIKEKGIEHPTLLVMPTSLIYNWQKEAEKFTPKMKILVHAGSNRHKTTEHFYFYDLIIMSYGVLRLDIDFIKNYRFNYVILDESQAIKNPSSSIARSVIELNAAHRLILTGTPLENSTMDLWSQMTFINPGLLGSQSFFRNHFQVPIEKHQNEEATKRLYAKIKPFMLRRHKSQVATELPEKIETIQYCDMTTEQEKAYEETKSYFRNMILDHIEKQGLNKSQLLVLQGLSKLRQIANNPAMVDAEYEGDSGKDNDVFHKLESVIEGGQKVLVFSQFVKHLSLIKKYLDKKNIKYNYLDGGTVNRQKEVDNFQNDESIKIFLISLKAGGVGLNLTAAEYVFLLDPWWNPAIEAQAIDRAHRIGQKNTVFTYKFITRNTIEEKILSLQNDKKRLFDDLITTEESFVKSLSQTDILSLLD